MNIIKTIKYAVLICIICQIPSNITAEEIAPYLIHTGGEKDCKQGLHPQPGYGHYQKPNGPFSIYIFCDLALGNNIGIICTEPGAGPGEIELPIKSWYSWRVDNRFWQETSWSTDVNSFAWSPSGKYVYVATNGTYGDGKLHKIDLINRASRTIVLKDEAKYNLNDYERYTTIDEINIDKKMIKVTMYLLSADDKEIFLKDEIKIE